MKKILFLLGACIIFSACSTGDAATSTLMLKSSSQALVFLNCRAVSEDVIEFEFSQPVKVTSLSFDPVLSIDSVEDGSTVRVKLAQSAEPGIMLIADLLAEDSKKNTINVLVSLRSRNNRMPDLVINEICTEYSNPRAEFVELKMMSAGNLGAMRLVILGNTNATRRTIYEFLPVEVKKDEYVVLHLRTTDTASRNEYGSNLAESGGANSSPTARDFWIPGSTKLIHKTSVVYVLDQDDNVLAAVMLSEEPGDSWSRDYFTEAAEFLYLQDAWKSADGNICNPSNAVMSRGTTNTRTICRDETVKNTKTSADWYITHTSSATPGRENNPRRYVP